MHWRIAAGACMRSRFGGVLIALASFWPAATFAAQFTLAPTRVLLPPNALAGTVVLGNEAEREVSFEVNYQRWRMGANGQWLLEPSDDLIVHPQVLTVPGKGKAVIRVGSLRRADAEGERAYRLLIQELPGEHTSEGAAITMLTRLSLPVFVQVAKPESDLQLIQASVHPDRIELRVRNQGNTFAPPGDAGLDLIDDTGAVRHHDSVAIPYTLSGAEVALTRPLPPGLCARAHRIALDVGEPQRHLELPLTVSDRSCGE